MYVGGDHSFRCQDCPKQMGFSLKLIYHMTSLSTGLFSTLLTVPPKTEFGLRTQFSCPIDNFMFLNHDHNLEAISIVSSCLSVNLGQFPILGLETRMYIFDKCKNFPVCSILNPADAKIIAWSDFPNSLSKISLGYFIELLPVSDSNKTGIVVTFAKDYRHLKAKLLNIKVSLFDITFNTTATVDESQLEFTETVNLYNKYPVELKGTIEQTADWNSASIKIFGRFPKSANTIPKILCEEANKYIKILHRRFKSRARNAEIVYNRARSQYMAAELTYKEKEMAKNRSGNLIQLTEEELNEINNTITSLENKLQTASDEVKQLTRRINELCTIKQCPEICIPQQFCQECQPPVSTLILGTCRVPCTKQETYTVITGYVRASKWEFVRRQFCPLRCLCRRIFNCFTATRCRTVSRSVRVYYQKAITERRVRVVSTFCDKPCSEVLVQDYVSAPRCCANVGCAQKEQDFNCLNQNQMCGRTRSVLYSNLALEQRKALEVLQLLDKARANYTVTNLRLMRYKVNNNLVDKQYSESKLVVAEARVNQDIATASYEAVKNKNQLDALENVRNGSLCNSYLKSESLSFNTTIITESPSVLPIDITILPYTSNDVTVETVYIDLHRFDSSLKQAAISVAQKIISQKALSKRHSRDAINASTEDENYLTFQRKCSEVKNILAYLKELNTSIFNVALVAISSMSNLDDNMLEISNLINTSSGILNQQGTVDFQQVATITNQNVTSLKFSNDFNLSEEANEQIKLMQEHLENGQELVKNIDSNLFHSWQAKMELLHNKTKSAAGFSCIGFSDCLQEVTESLNELINDVPLNNMSITAFSDAIQDLLDLALLQNYSIISAIKNTQKMYDIANDSLLMDYWCASIPKIVIQPAKRINPREKSTLELSCKAEVEQFTTYQWKKDGIQIPNQRNSTLVLTNVQLRDSGNYTCVVTNQATSVTSTNASVEVQQLPTFFLQPDNIDEYLGNWNGAIFKSNATGFPYPGFRWYFQPKGVKGFTQIPDEDQNELIVVPPLPKDEGSYYCEAFNEQGYVKSRIVNLTVLDSTVVQVSQTAHLNFSLLSKFEELNSSAVNINNSVELSGSGSGEDEFSGLENTTLMPTPTEVALQSNLIKVLNLLMTFGSTSLSNVTIHSNSDRNIAVSFTIYSQNVSYPETSLSEINQLAPQARVEWLPVWERLQALLTSSRLIIIDDNENEYESDSSSVKFDMLHYSCPAGKEVSSINNFLCGKYASYIVLSLFM